MLHIQEVGSDTNCPLLRMQRRRINQNVFEPHEVHKVIYRLDTRPGEQKASMRKTSGVILGLQELHGCL